MSSSSAKQKRGRKAWKYLVFWFPKDGKGDGEVTVEDAARIPSMYRRENASFQRWLPEKGKNRAMYNVKIVKKGEDAEALNEIGVHPKTGEILPATTKAFTSIIMAKKKAAGKQQREAAIIAKDSSNYTGVKLLTEPTWLCKANATREVCEISPTITPLSTSPTSGTHRQCVGELNANLLRAEEFSQHSGIDITNSSGNVQNVNTIPRSSPTPSTISSPQNNITFKQTFQEVLDPDISAHCSWQNQIFIEKLYQSLTMMKATTSESCIASNVFEALLERIHHYAARKVASMEQKPQHIRLPDHYFVNGPQKVQIFPAQQIFISQSMKALIDVRLTSAKNSDWKYYSDVLLNEIYGNNLRYMSCEGKRGTQGIHYPVRQGLYEYAVTIDPTVTDRDVTHHINHTIGNVKTAWKRIQNSKNSKSTKASTKSTISAVDDSHNPVNSNSEIQYEQDEGRNEDSNMQDDECSDPLLLNSSPDIPVSSACEEIQHEHVSCEQIPANKEPLKIGDTVDDSITITPECGTPCQSRISLPQTMNFESSLSSHNSEYVNIDHDSCNTQHQSSHSSFGDCVTQSLTVLNDSGNVIQPIPAPFTSPTGMTPVLQEFKSSSHLYQSLVSSEENYSLVHSPSHGVSNPISPSGCKSDNTHHSEPSPAATNSNIQYILAILDFKNPSHQSILMMAIHDIVAQPVL